MNMAAPFHRLHGDERGDSPILVMASVVVFLILGLTVSAVLIGALTGGTMLRINTALSEVTSTAAKTAAMQGYGALAALPASADIDLKVGERTVTAVRTVQVNASSRTARVSITVGKYGPAGFVNSRACAKQCVVATELVSGAAG